MAPDTSRAEWRLGGCEPRVSQVLRHRGSAAAREDIGEARENVAKHQGDPKPSPGPLFDLAERGWREPQRLLASLLMRRDKILRVLGRDPNAGLAGAREWVKSDDPELVQDAVDVFEDIGGHQQELGAAKSTLERVEQPASPADLL